MSIGIGTVIVIIIVLVGAHGPPPSSLNRHRRVRPPTQASDGRSPRQAISRPATYWGWQDEPLRTFRTATPLRWGRPERKAVAAESQELLS
jgi:hypothetical protein